jgi:hypothetical protein
MKKRYQIARQRAVQEFRQLAREQNPNLQMIVPMTEVVGLLQEGVGHLMREAGLALMSLVMEEEVRHLAGSGMSSIRRGGRIAGGRKVGTAWWTGRRYRSSARVCARRRSVSSGWAVTKCFSAAGRWSTRCGTS